MSYTPSALSQQLSKLETEIGARLVERGPAGIRLTSVGGVLVEHGERVLGELHAAEAAVSSALGAEPRHIAIGTFATAGAVLVPAALAALRERHPAVQLSLLDLEPPGGYGLVTSGDLDLLITHRYPGVASVPTRGLVRQRLLTDPLRLVLPASHPVATATPSRVRLADLAGQQWISGGSGVPNRTCLDSIAAQAGFAPEISYETADYALTLALVRVGLGLALVPSIVLGADAGHGITVRDLRPTKPSREICIVHRKRPSALVVELVALLRAAAAGVSGSSR